MNLEIGLSNGFVLHPDTYYRPSYRISPFATADIQTNLSLPYSDSVNEYFDSRFGEKAWVYTKTGKEAIGLAIQALSLKPSDCITLVTTSGNHYISACVTKEIEKYCRWSRSMEKATMALLVNHEFGHPHRDLKAIRAHGLPVIEDACHSFLADTPSADMGSGDFILFSLPKIFPIQLGGVLAFDSKYSISSSVTEGNPLQSYLSKVASHYVDDISRYQDIRRRNFHRLAEHFLKLGCSPRFELLDNDVPGVFMFKVPEGIDLSAMKEYGWLHGIECSVFYGEQAFFIPCHQRLTDVDLNYFVTVFGSFLAKSRT